MVLEVGSLRSDTYVVGVLMRASHGISDSHLGAVSYHRLVGKGRELSGSFI